MRNMEFYLSHVKILGIHHCNKELCKEFQQKRSHWDVKRCRDYAEKFIERSVNQIEYECYSGKTSVFLEGIPLYNFFIQQHIKSISVHKILQVMLCFSHFFSITENRMLQLHLHTLNITLNISRNVILFYIY